MSVDDLIDGNESDDNCDGDDGDDNEDDDNGDGDDDGDDNQCDQDVIEPRTCHLIKVSLASKARITTISLVTSSH